MGDLGGGSFGSTESGILKLPRPILRKRRIVPRGFAIITIITSHPGASMGSIITHSTRFANSWVPQYN